MISERRLYRKIDARILPFLLVCYFFAYLDRVNIGFAKLQMQADIGIDDVTYGIGAGIFFIGYFMFEVPSNLLLARIGARLTLGRIMVLWGAVATAMLFVHDSDSFYILRFLLGVFEAGFAPGMIFYLTYWYPDACMARALAIVMAAAPVAGMVGAPISTWIMTDLAGTYGLAGWQWLFLLEGLPCIPLGLLAFRYLDDRPQNAAWLSADEKAAIHSAIGRSERPPAEFTQVIRDPRLYGLAFGYFCLINGFYLVIFWLPTLLKNAGADTMEIGLYSAIPYGVGIIFMVLVSLHSDRVRERRWHSGGLAVAASFTLAVAAGFVDQLALALFFLTLATGFLYGSYIVFWAVPSAYLKGSAAAGGIALINSIGLLGGFLSPVFIGFIKSLTGSFESGLYAMAGLVLAGAVTLIFAIPSNGRIVERRKA